MMQNPQKRTGTPGFGPIYAPGARALVLGSYPSPKSFAAGFYYGHPQNRFWPLLATLAGRPLPGTKEDKCTLVTESGLALWDSLASCTITGAADSTIEDPVPNDIAALVQKTGIEAIFCNGAASHRYYTRFCEKGTGIAAVRLPSTSPANAAFTFPRLLATWQPLAAYITPP